MESATTSTARRARRATGKASTSSANVVVADYHVVKPTDTQDGGAMRAVGVERVEAQVDASTSHVQQHVILRIKSNAGPHVVGYTEHNQFTSDPMELSTTSQSSEAKAEVKSHAKMVAQCEDNPPTTACFWCCHPCGCSPVGLPVAIKEGKLQTTGCFCSFECAAAFNFNSKELFQDPWTSFELLNQMARSAGYDKVVQPAPSRYSLKMFGGWLDIAEFRRSPKLINTLPAPMMSIVQYMEEIMASDIMHGTLPSQTPPAFVPLDQDRVLRAKQNLMASNNLKCKKNTIHERMNLRTRLPSGGSDGNDGHDHEGATTELKI